MNTFSKADSYSLAITGISADFSMITHLLFPLIVPFLLQAWHPVLWIHVFVSFASMLFIRTTLQNIQDQVPVFNERILALGRKVLTISSLAAPSVWILGTLVMLPFYQSAKGTPNETSFIQAFPTAILRLYFLALAASISGIGLITSGLYDVQGAKTPGNR
ncbi:MAG: hypothetical protein HGA38_01315 [Candidatus Moranbacteria bacterium]|nr:hypothetical protein [Candidatus Moranbacteria bacterium]